jgi:transposase
MSRKGLNVKRTWGGKEKIQKLIKQEKNGKVKERLQAILWRLKGETYTQIAENLNKQNITITEWVKKWNKTGYDGLIDKPKPGVPPKLAPEQEKEIIKTVNQSARITCKVLMFKIQEEYGKEFTIGGIAALLHRHNLSWKKPKKKDYRQNEQEKKEYQEALKKRQKILNQRRWSGI